MMKYVIIIFILLDLLVVYSAMRMSSILSREEERNGQLDS